MFQMQSPLKTVTSALWGSAGHSLQDHIQCVAALVRVHSELSVTGLQKFVWSWNLNFSQIMLWRSR